MQPAQLTFTAAAAAQPDPANLGQWSPLIGLPNVPIHTHVLGTGKVLFWGRRNPPAQANFPSLNQQETHAFIWDPANPNSPARPTSNQPSDSHGTPINLFCSGHTFLGDGRLLVGGGHLFDSQGLNTSTFYDPSTDKWSAGPVMNNGRWYPTLVTLADGKAVVSSGSFPTGPLQPPVNSNTINPVSQILDNGAWQNLTPFNTLRLFPRFHVAPSGALFMSGSNATTFLLENFETTPGTWVPVGQRSVQNADYAPSVMFDVGKVVFIGGGSTTNVVEVIDLNVAKPAWAVIAPMNFRRRQHNATILADGTVLVTGGSQGTGFNDLGNQAVHISELWDPKTGTWTEMAAEAVDRCYHSTAVLLPDGRVFSGGGGEYAPTNNVFNPPSDTHANAQIFFPPYLFRGARPTITKAPAKVVYGENFTVESPDANAIEDVTWVRLGSVTHSFDQNQRINFLDFQHGANQLTVTAPANGNECPPGHYMLSILNQQKVPSVAVIVQIAAVAMAAVKLPAAAAPFRILAADLRTPMEQDAVIQKQEKQPPVEVGVTPTCPYGISACWGGAYEALSRLHGVRLVRPLPNAQDSTAYVYLEHEGLPDLDLWPEEFAKIANGTHYFRGVEVTIPGVLDIRPLGGVVMRGSDQRPPLFLEPIEAADKIQWDPVTAATKPLEPAEQDAYSHLLQRVKSAGGSLSATVTGPLRKSGNEYVLEVRKFSVP